MKKLNKVAMGLAALVGLNASALAAHPGDDVTLPAASAGVSLTAPQQMGYWSVGVEALLEQMGNHDFNYVFTQTNGANGADEWRAHAIDTDNDWGFRVDATYHFAGYGRDAKLSYARFSTKDSHRFHFLDEDEAHSSDLWWEAHGETDFGNAADFENGAIKGVTSDTYHEIDLTFGQLIDVGRRVTLHPFAGLRYADLEARQKGHYVSFSAANTVDQVYFTRHSSDFDGLGPRFGSDVQVNIGSGFSFVGRVGVSALVGKMEHRGSIFSANSVGTTNGLVVWRNDSQTRVVPELDARLGVNYAMNITRGTGLQFELGYEAINYFDALSLDVISNTLNVTNDVDYALHGPYFRLQVDFT